MKTNQITPDGLPPGPRSPGLAGAGRLGGWVEAGAGGSRLIHCERLDVQQQLRGGSGFRGVGYIYLWFHASGKGLNGTQQLA